MRKKYRVFIIMTDARQYFAYQDAVHYEAGLQVLNANLVELIDETDKLYNSIHSGKSISVNKQAWATKKFAHTWKEYLKNSGDGLWMMAEEYYDIEQTKGNRIDFDTTDSLRIAPLKRKAGKNKLLKYDGLNTDQNTVVINNIVDYSAWILWKKDYTTIDESNYPYFLHRLTYQCMRLVYDMFEITHFTITPRRIKNRIEKDMKDIINNTFKKPKKSKYEAAFAVLPETSISKATGEYRNERAVEWMKEYFEAFNKKYGRYPTMDEIQFWFQEKLRVEADPTMRLFEGKDVTYNTMMKWLKAGGLKDRMTRKSKSLGDLHFDKLEN